MTATPRPPVTPTTPKRTKPKRPRPAGTPGTPINKRRPPPRKPPPRTRPSSPTTSSRSRKTKGTPPPNSLVATSPRRPSKRRNHLSVDSIPLPFPLASRGRLFGHEIQCLMHAFGEIRYCARDVLAIMEDAVRDTLVRIVTLSNGNVQHLARCIQHNPHAVQRLNISLRNTSAPKLQPGPKATDIILDLGFETERPSELHINVCRRAMYAFGAAMPATQFQDFLLCKSMSMVQRESRSNYAKIRGQPRINLFKEWLSLPSLSEHALLVLGHIAWEAIGELTQTALMVRYWNDVAQGRCDPRAESFTFGKHVLAGVAYGLVSGVMLNLTDLQVQQLRSEIDSYCVVTSAGGGKWRGYEYASSPCLLPKHVNEALRILSGRQGGVFGTGGGIDFGLTLPPF